MLNSAQRQAIQTTEGPLRIIAGAGTGKTFTLINRINYLITEKDTLPNKILTLTFTNKAAHELKERLVKMGQPNTLALTFHSLAAKLLRKYWQADFEILSSKEAEKILAEVLNKEEEKKIREILTDISTFQRSKLIIPPEEENPYFLSSLNPERISEIAETYTKKLTEKNALDFSSLLTKLLEIWRDKPETLQQCQELFSHVLVDEYQDVNAIQIEILKKLVEAHKNICVVGDGDQTIYSWRGAKASTMQEFENMFPATKSITLTQNYRNPPAILRGAEELIQNNSDRLKKKLEAALKKAGVIKFWKNKNEYQEYEVLFYLLEKYLGSTSDMHMADQLDTEHHNSFCKLSDIALLYRTQAQGKVLAETLSKKGYPYQISSGEYFWERKEIKKFLIELESISSFIPNLPVRRSANEGGIGDPENIKVDSSAVADGNDKMADVKFSHWITERIEDFINAEKLSKNQANRLRQLITYSIQFDNLYLSEALQAFLDETKTEQEADNLLYADRINLLTLHAAKGLEFPIVLIFGLEEGEIPAKKSKDDPYFLEEERRLLYVGMTRAKEELHLFCKQTKNEKEQSSSRFLAEIKEENLHLGTLPEERRQRLRKKEMKKAQMKLF